MQRKIAQIVPGLDPQIRTTRVFKRRHRMDGCWLFWQWCHMWHDRRKTQSYDGLIISSAERIMIHCFSPYIGIISCLDDEFFKQSEVCNSLGLVNELARRFKEHKHFMCYQSTDSQTKSKTVSTTVSIIYFLSKLITTMRQRKHSRKILQKCLKQNKPGIRDCPFCRCRNI